MIELILPTHVASFETFRDPPEASLLPQEHVYVQDSVESRRREFTTGRHCARRALASLGAPDKLPLRRGAKGAVTWPDGITGSITHCRGYRAAAVARISETASVGIDAEPDQPLPDGVLEAVALPEEQVMVKELLAEFPGVRWDKLLFSAKESIYKTWYPLTRRPLEFEDAVVEFEPDGGRFTARLHPRAVYGVPGAPREFAGRWVAGNGLLVSAIAFPAAVRFDADITFPDSTRRGEVFA